jgi:hypothetical protein
MVPMGRPGKLVSNEIPEVERFHYCMAFMLYLPAVAFIVLSVMERDTVVLFVAIGFVLMGSMFLVNPVPRKSVHENGVVVRNPVLGDRFYPWAMFYYYWVRNDPEAKEGHRTCYCWC